METYKIYTNGDVFKVHSKHSEELVGVYSGQLPGRLRKDSYGRYAEYMGCNCPTFSQIKLVNGSLQVIE